MPVENAHLYELTQEAVASLPVPLCLEFDPNVPASVRPRIEYAFRVFGAIFGRPVTIASSAGDRLRLIYGGTARRLTDTDAIRVPALYLARKTGAFIVQPESALTTCEYAGHAFPLFLGVDSHSRQPDWLGEIFLWLSGELELQTQVRDAAGRIPFSETVFAKYRISPRQPHAALLMAWFENVLQRNPVPALPKPPSPLWGIDHIILASHDIDFYFSSRRSALLRFAKNLLIAVSHYRSASFFRDNLRMGASLGLGKRPGAFLPALLDAVETQGFQTTLFSVVRRAHRRDPNYSLETVAGHLSKALARGFSVGLHGSYRSLSEDRSLASEASILGERLGKRPRANRQHWLRFESHAHLFRELESAGMAADSSLGFPEAVGFRNGANFAFPPYDFQRECPHRFLEIPLALMDGGLEAAARQSGVAPQVLAEEVLQASRSAGWGGISLLWHNPLEPISVPREINDVFWTCARNRENAREAWLTFDQFLSLAVHRYQRAGLLEGICANA